MSWEQPPPGGGAGPVGGGGSSGGAGTPPEGPMQAIPFSETQLRNLTGTSRVMLIAGIVTMVGALTGIVSSVTVAFVAGEGTEGIVGSLCGGVFEAVVAALLGVWLVLGSRSVQRVVQSDEADQTHLVDAIQKLRNVFILKALYVVLIILLFCVLTGGLAVLQ